MIFAIDFDGTLHDVNRSLPGRRMGGPRPGSREFCEALARAGQKYWVFTAQGNQPHIREWLRFWNFPRWEGITNIKRLDFDFIIDDRALSFPETSEDWHMLARRYGLV